jgi:Pyruvate/2-oxoacid:ferredoxin oxidoreductase gamma subunit
MGNGVWTVEIIPAEIQPPPRNAAGASGNRIRIGSAPVTNWGDETNLIIAFNEQALLGRHRLGALADDAIILIDDQWKTHGDERIREAWAAAMAELSTRAYRIIEVPLEEQCLTVVDNARKGKNMFALGLLAWIYEPRCGADPRGDRVRVPEEVRGGLQKNVALLELGIRWARRTSTSASTCRHGTSAEPRVVMNGNQAVALGAIASGMELIAMYPITPATSASHQLSESSRVRRHRAPGGGRDRRGGVAHRRVVGGPHRVHHHVGSGPRAEDGVPRLAVMTETPLVWSTCSAAGRARACRRRSSSRTCWRRCSASRATRRTSSSRRPPSRSASTR